MKPRKFQYNMSNLSLVKYIHYKLKALLNQSADSTEAGRD